MSTTAGMLLLIGRMLASVIFVASAWNHYAQLIARGCTVPKEEQWMSP
jgi:hypothetical protein